MSPVRTDKGLPTPQNCAVLLIDYQPQMIYGVANIDGQTLLNSTLVRARAAKVFGVPVVLAQVELSGFSGLTRPALLDLFPGVTPIERTTAGRRAVGGKSGGLTVGRPSRARSGRQGAPGIRPRRSGRWQRQCSGAPPVLATKMEMDP